MNAYNCTKCGAGLYSAAEVKEPLCAECELDDNLVEVVRCKDCIYFFKDEVNTWCKQFGEIYATPNDYCAWGKRRTE